MRLYWLVDTAFEILVALSFCHLLNDMMQSLIPAIYPILKQNFQLDFAQIGLITFVLQLTGALLQPVSASIPIGTRSRTRSRRGWGSRCSA